MLGLLQLSLHPPQCLPQLFLPLVSSRAPPHTILSTGFLLLMLPQLGMLSLLLLHRLLLVFCWWPLLLHFPSLLVLTSMPLLQLFFYCCCRSRMGQLHPRAGVDSISVLLGSHGDLKVLCCVVLHCIPSEHPPPKQVAAE